MWDLRRWKAYEGVTLDDEAKNKPRYQQLLNLYGVKVEIKDSGVRFTYGKAETVNTRVFNSPKNYLFPIPNNEVKRAPNLGQNPGW
jgi:hypothetical protein